MRSKSHSINCKWWEGVGVYNGNFRNSYVFCGGNQQNDDNTTRLPEVTGLPDVVDKRFHIKLNRVHLTTVEVDLTIQLRYIGTYYIGSRCKQNYSTMTTTTCLMLLTQLYTRIGILHTCRKYLYNCIISLRSDICVHIIGNI